MAPKKSDPKAKHEDDIEVTEPDAVEAAEAVASDNEPGVHVALLPVKLKQNRYTLSTPFHAPRGAQNIVVKGVLYPVADVAFNPHNQRQEIALVEKTLIDQAELDHLIAAGWTQEA